MTSAPGSFSSLPAALEAARKLRQGATNPPVTILLRDGWHCLPQALELGPQDSFLTIAAEPGARPVVTSGQRITGFVPDPQRPGVWQVTLPLPVSFRSLFINGQRAIRARTPNEGYFQMQGSRFQDKPVQFTFRNRDIRPEWAGNPEIELIGLEKWTTFRQHVAGVDIASNVVTLSSEAANHTREANARYWVENAPEALDAPGEWRLDTRSGQLSYITRPGENPNNLEVTAPRANSLLHIRGGSTPVRAITLRGITFAHTDWTMPAKGQVDVQAAVAIPAAITAEGTVDLVIEDCTLEHLGGYGIEFGRGSKLGVVRGCTLRDLGAGGVKIGETTVRSAAADACEGHIVTDNEMTALGRVNPSAVGVLILQSGWNVVSHNHIHDLYYTAISVGWTWGYQESPCRYNSIEFNHLHNIGQGMLSDMGGIYTLGPQPGTRLRNNLIHDVTADNYGGWGLYTDEGSTGILLESNVVFRCKSAGFHQHYGRENIVRNNVFALNQQHELMRTREEPHLSFYFTNNIVYLSSGDLLGSNWRNDRFLMDRNLYFDTRLGAVQDSLRFSGRTLTQWRAAGHDQASLLRDPLFVAPEKDDFRLRPTSPAHKFGIKPPDVHSVGVRPPNLRRP